MRLTAKRLSLVGIAGVGLLLGLLREVVVAREVGAGAAMDAYAAVFGIYLFFGVQMANASETTFIARYAALGDAELCKKMVSVLGAQVLLMLPVVLLLTIYSGPIVRLLFAFDPDRERLAAGIVQLFAPAVFLGAQVGVMRAVLYIRERFIPGLLVGSLISLSVIGNFLIAEKPTIEVLPQGYWMGNVFVLSLFAVLLWRQFRGTEWRFSLWQGFSLWKFGYLVVIAEIIFQGCYTLERAVASAFPIGTVAAFFYAVAVTQVFVTLVVQPVSIVFFPHLTRLFKSEPHEALRLMKRVIMLLVAASLLVVLIVLMFAEPIVRIVFVRGAFDLDDASRTANMLQIVVLTLPFISIGGVVKKALYAKGFYGSPIFVNSTRLAGFILSALLLVGEFGVTGFAWAYVIAIAMVPLAGVILLLSRHTEGVYEPTG